MIKTRSVFYLQQMVEHQYEARADVFKGFLALCYELNKTSLLLLFLLIICSGSSVLAQAHIGSHRTGCIRYRFLENNGPLVLTDSCHIAYSSSRSDQVSKLTWYSKTEGGWEPKSQEMNAYDSSGAIMLVDTRTWNSGTNSFPPDEKLIYINNSTGKPLEMATESWNASLSAYVVKNRSFYSYDTGNNLIQTLQIDWHSWVKSWDSFSKENLIVNSSGKTVSSIKQIWDQYPGTWRNTSRSNYSYDATGVNNIQISEFSWDISSQAWIPETLITYTLNTNGSPGVGIFQHWNRGSNIYDNYLLASYRYDAAGNKLGTIYKFWSDELGAYTIGLEDSFTYNNDNQWATYSSVYWNKAGTRLTDYHYIYYYEAYSTAAPAEVEKLNIDVSISPIPASQSVSVSIDCPKPQPLTISIIDMSGRVCKSVAAYSGMKYKVVIPVIELAEGSYVLNITGEGTSKFTRLINITH